jgi:glutamate mutase epsilon subunit
MLLIRPFFPRERKRVYIRVLDEHVENIKVLVDSLLSGFMYSIDIQNYAADNKYKKVYVTLPTEENAQSFFS